MSNDVWSEDRFSRQEIADDIEQFIESRIRYPTLDEGALTIALDADYGAGKSFFLKRLQAQLSEKHPVAFVDAWKDDSGDDPLLALMLAISEALSEKLRHKLVDPKLRKDITAAVGSVSKIALKAILRGGLKFVTTETSVKEIEEVFSKGLDDTFNETLDKSVASETSLLISRRKQIAAFQSELAKLLEEVEKIEGQKVCLTILVDELDRCRPTYALKLLEESKHFFDSTNTVFVFATKLESLSHTIRAVYGERYNAEHYLSRFVKYTLKLPPPTMTQFVIDLVKRAPFPETDWVIVSSGRVDNSVDAIATWLANLFSANGLNARDVERVMDSIVTASSIRSDNFPVQLASMAPQALQLYLVQSGRRDNPNGSLSVPSVHGIEGSGDLYTRMQSNQTYAIKPDGKSLSKSSACEYF